jgi:uncharacterized protein YlxP (DUF503 family)
MVCEIRIFKLFIPHSNSLKTKRQAIKSLVEKLKNRFNVSVVELSGNDVWQRADIGVGLLSNHPAQAEEELQRIEQFILFSGQVLITDVEKASY